MARKYRKKFIRRTGRKRGMFKTMRKIARRVFKTAGERKYKDGNQDSVALPTDGTAGIYKATPTVN